MADLQSHYPWTDQPLVAGGPMRLIALSKLAYAISKAGGLGFIGAGSDASTLADELEQFATLCGNDEKLGQYTNPLPVGIGFLLWAGDKLLENVLPILAKHKPAAVWFFAPRQMSDLPKWTREISNATNGVSKVWIQVGNVSEAVDAVATCQPDVLVVQGTDAGGHGLQQCAGLFPLFPEVDDALSTLCDERQIRKPALLAAGGIIDGRGGAAALSLGASGMVMGTRYLASPEANIAPGYRKAVLRADDGGVSTARGKLYDTLRGTTDWPSRYGGRSVLNESWFDAENGMGIEENKRLYDAALETGDEGWGERARLTTYAGSGVGLVKQVQSAADITLEVREESKRILKRAASRF